MVRGKSAKFLYTGNRYGCSNRLASAKERDTMKKVLGITIQRKTKQWNFETVGDEKHIEEWRADGVQIDEVVNKIPEWIVIAGMSRIWCFFQNLFWIPIVR
jgi:hypothetical protein